MERSRKLILRYCLHYIIITLELILPTKFAIVSCLVLPFYRPNALLVHPFIQFLACTTMSA